MKVGFIDLGVRITMGESNQEDMRSSVMTHQNKWNRL